MFSNILKHLPTKYLITYITNLNLFFCCKDTTKNGYSHHFFAFFMQNDEQTFARQTSSLYCRCFIGCPPQTVSLT